MVRFVTARIPHSSRLLSTYCLLFLLAAGALFMTPFLHAQATGTLNGTVRDAEGGAIPGAKITVTSVASKAVRSTVSNGEGYFTVNAIQPDTYNVTINAKGFETLAITGIQIDPGDSRTIEKAVLKVGSVETEITVSAQNAGVSLDSPEKSSLITAEDIQRLSTVGRDATELIKILPGFAVNAVNLTNGNNSDSQQTMGFGSSSVSGYSANGATPQTGATTVISDGASVMDPGDMGASISNINMDMVAEIKVSTSNFGADSAKGPVIIQAVGISGGANYHGSAYIYVRNGSLNANDWLNNYNDVARPASEYYYPGARITGPVRIPGTNFNSSKKLTFALAYEYYKQTRFDQLLSSFIPTPRMLSGDLTPAAIGAALNLDPSVVTKACPNDYTDNGGTSTTGVALGPLLTNSGGYCYSPGLTGTTYSASGSLIHAGVDAGTPNGLLKVDPNALVYAKFWPTPNHTPRPAFGLASDGYNYVNAITSTHNGYQLHGRVDENFTQNTKLYVTYQLEQVNDEDPITNGFYAGSDIIPYPNPAYTHSKSNLLSMNFTHVFSPTLTNELVPAGTLFYSPVQLSNRNQVQDSATGFTGGRYYNNGALQLPGIIDYENGVPDFAMTYFSTKGQYFRKFSYDIADNLTKQLRTHSIKVGAYYEETANNQVPYNYAQGVNAFNHYNSGCYTSDGTNHISQLQNNVANFLQGCTAFTQSSNANAVDLYFRTLDFYATDEWKATKRLTLTYGLRFDHLGPWFDPHGVGLAVWNPPTPFTALQSVITQDPRTFPGISWHQTNPNVPLSGSPTTFLFYSPRAGLAYDLYGDGKTVFRGGWGAYRFHDSYNDSAGPLGTSNGTQSYTSYSNVSCTYSQLTAAGGYATGAPSGPCQPISTGSVNPFSLYALDPHDSQQPVTFNYNLTVDQAFIKKTNVEISYIGNQSHHLFTEGNLNNQDVIPLGALFQPDPLNGVVSQPGNTQQIIQDYRPYPYYTAVYVPHHIAYGNYNGLQASFTKNKGPLNFNINYTWAKALGIHGDYRTGAVGDPTVLRHNYGYLGFNRSQAVNFSYSYQVGNAYHGKKLIAALVNQWLISGITNLQSGPDTAVLNGTSNTNYNLSGAVAYTPAGSTQSIPINLNSTTVLGTPDINLQPVVTCNPKSHLVKGSIYGHDYINGSCFALPQVGTNGQFELPDIHGPSYFKTDLTLQRGIRLTAQKNLEFRLAGFNFLNHPLPQFYGGPAAGVNGLSLSYGLPTGVVATTPQQAIASAIQTSTNFGFTPYKGGYRVLEVEARFNF